MRKKSTRKIRPVVLPLGIKRLDLIEMPGHVALLALGQDWLTDSHYADLFSSCYLGLDLSEPDSRIHQLAKQGIQLLTDRSTDHELMRSVIGTVLQWVATQPNVKIHNAVCNRLNYFDRKAKDTPR